MNRKLFVTLILVLIATQQLFAQLGLGLKINRSTYMRYEPIYAFVAIRNDTGKPLIFGKDPRLQGFVLFDVRDKSDRPIAKRDGQEILIDNLVIRPGETKPLVLQINKFYNIDQPGTYRVRAYISHPLLPHDFQSNQLMFRVDEGVTGWSKTVGVPDLDQKGKIQEERTYSLRSIYDGPNRFQYLVVENPTHILGVMRIGRAIGQEKIHAEIDQLSRIHLLVPLTPAVFQYLSFSLDGSNMINQYWKTSGSIPTLIRDNSGKVFVAGGEPAVAGVDFQSPESGKLTAAQLAEEYERDFRAANPNQPTPTTEKAPQNSGLVDVGKDL